MRLLLIAIGLFAVSVSFGQSHQFYLFIGGYTTGKNEGIHVYRFNANDGTVVAVGKVKSDSPSYLAISNNGKYVYAANETGKGRAGSASAFAFDNKSGTLSLINKKDVGGNGPCFISTDKKNGWLFTANYASGSVSILKLKEDGSIDTLQQVLQHTGSSIVASRQKEPHAHTAMFSPSGTQLFTTDLGTDKINAYQFAAGGKAMPLSVTSDSVIISKAGNGPRHIAFHHTKKIMYVVNELAGTIDIYDYKKQIKLLQTISTDTSNSKDKGSADIHLSNDGRFLYATNRGNYNNIAIFKVGPKNGSLQFVTVQPSLGKTPRNFMIDPTDNYLLVAHQNSDNIIIFKRDKASGLLTDTGNKIETGNPSCLKMVAVE